MITFTYNDSGFTAQMGNVISQARNPRAVMAAAGREGANQLRAHFRKKDKDGPNKLAPDRRQHFWLDVAHGVQAPVVDANGQKVTITILHPAIAQKVFGGTITAKRGKNLAIPESPEAYGRAPAVFERETGLKLIFIKANGHAFLAARLNEYSQFLQVEYLLTPSVHQEPDPTALPDEAKLRTAILARAQKVLDRQLQEGKE